MRKGEKIKILYNRIRHCFYQSPDDEIVILIHFHLKSGIMVNKKQHVDITFYTEVGEVSTDLGKRYGGNDNDTMFGGEDNDLIYGNENGDLI